MRKESVKMIERSIRLAASMLGKVGGTARTPAKQRASRENGRKGGRPRKPFNQLTPAGKYQRVRRKRLQKGEK